MSKTKRRATENTEITYVRIGDYPFIVKDFEKEKRKN